VTQSVPKARLSLIEKIVAAAPGRERDAGSAEFLRAYYRGVGETDLAERPARLLRSIAMAHRSFGARRPRGKPLVRVFNPAQKLDGFDSQGTIVFVITDNMPFLLDSINIVLAAAGAGVNFLAHPVFSVQREARGRLRSLLLADPKDGRVQESWQMFEIDRQESAAHCQALQDSITKSLLDVRVAVADWRAMRARIREISAGLAASPPRRTPAVETREACALLDWMEAAHFIFLGYRHYQLQRGSDVDLLLPTARSGLGILRNDTARGRGAKQPNKLAGTMRTLARDHSVLVLTKANSTSTVHRGTYLDYVAVKDFDAAGEPCGEHRFLGLWTSTAYFASPAEIPVLRRKVQQVVQHFGLDPQGHDAKAVSAVMETYPRDELFQATTAELVDVARGVVNLYERRQTRLMVRRDPFGRFWSCMVYVPRDRYTTDVRLRVEKLILTRFGGTHVETQVQIADTSHARLHVVVRLAVNDRAAPDLKVLEQDIARAAMTWDDRLREVLLATHEPTEAFSLAQRYKKSFPLAYQDEVDPADSLDDIADLESLRASPDSLRLSLHRPPGAPLSRAHLKLVKLGDPIPISDLLPMMENFGLRVLAERPYSLRDVGGGPACVQDFEFDSRSGTGLDIDAVEARFTAGFLAAWRGEVENDGFNRLLLGAGLNAREIVILRSYCRYLLQTGLPFSQANMERVLATHAGIARQFLELFTAQFAPEFPGKRAPAIKSIIAAIRKALDGVTSADDDRILRAYLTVICATLRTNFYQPAGAGSAKSYVVFKFDPRQIPDLPAPRPKFEIFVYSPRVEGVHLRMGQVARGGIRWSDRREDFRTEVLGLMKAQNVKNTLIVPVGAKGGFFPKQMPVGASRDAVQAEGIACYQIFIRGLLDVTDNIVGGRIVPPQSVVRRDADDPYLVVAADKGTATFSDIANKISVDHGFWLGDAFASGGSAGYDHKKMGITARGAWECVKRHFREMGVDTQQQDFTVAGIGDMAGDVFGNGMLLSKHICLRAAFNHQHIFLDPAPDAARSFAERERLFNLPRSSWDDYDRKLISRGGGIFARTAKTIALSSEAQAMLGLGASAAPNAVIHAILGMKVDLLWNGGIGTYVKAATESHQDARDRANDAVRIDGGKLRARVVGEGGNLGFTQRGRVEYALAGGRINTDFIDNSAGVNTSDLEVNLKILLSPEERAGRLKRRDRDTLLARMTDEVAAQVLRNNYLQSQAISTLEAQATRRTAELQYLIRSLERSGELDRALEYLPDDESIAERRKQGLGFTRPELAVLLAYSKISLNNQLLDSDVPEDSYLGNELERYFAAPIRRRFARAIGKHRLRREIIATAATNSLVNRMGPSFVLRAQDDTGATPAEITRAYSIAREAFGMRAHWARIEALDNGIPASVQYGMMAETSRILRHSTYWLLRERRRELAIEARVREFAEPLARLAQSLDKSLAGIDREHQQQALATLQKAGVPKELASFMAGIGALGSAWDIAELAAENHSKIEDTASIWFRCGAALGLDWLRSEIERMPVDGQWQAVARSGLRDAAAKLQRSLSGRALVHRARGSADERTASWLTSLGASLTVWQRTLKDIRGTGNADFATLSVGVDALRRLAG
jgi:glutamate dehydrogenase